MKTESIRSTVRLRDTVEVIGRNTPVTSYMLFASVAERHAREQRRRERRTAFISAITPTRLIALFKRG